jgi:hypothetical protein
MTVSTNAHEQELIDVERRFWNAMQEKDADTASMLTDDQCVIVGAQGVSSIDAKTMAKLTTEGAWELKHYAFDDQARQIRFLTDDIAIVAYPVTERVVVDGETLPIEANDSSVWVRRNGEWLCALHTESLAGDPYGRDRVPAS